MIIRVNESKLKSVISKCVKQVLNESYDDEYYDERKRAEIDAAWDEFENSGPFATPMSSYSSLSESIRRSVRKAIRKYTR